MPHTKCPRSSAGSHVGRAITCTLLRPCRLAESSGALRWPAHRPPHPARHLRQRSGTTNFPRPLLGRLTRIPSSKKSHAFVCELLTQYISEAPPQTDKHGIPFQASLAYVNGAVLHHLHERQPPKAIVLQKRHSASTTAIEATTDRG